MREEERARLHEKSTLRFDELLPYVCYRWTDTMNHEKKDDRIEVQCPVCKKTIEVSAAEAEKKMSVRCPKGHEVPLVKIL